MRFEELLKAEKYQHKIPFSKETADSWREETRMIWEFFREELFMFCGIAQDNADAHAIYTDIRENGGLLNRVNVAALFIARWPLFLAERKRRRNPYSVEQFVDDLKKGRLWRRLGSDFLAEK